MEGKEEQIRIHRKELFDCTPEPHYTELLDLACQACHTDKAALCLFDGPELRCKAAKGPIPDATLSAVAAATREGRPMLCLEGGEPFLATALIFLPGCTSPCGALCVLEDRPRAKFAENSRVALDLLSRQAAAHLAATLRVASIRQEMVDFLARVSHELRTPLTGVVGISELLQSSLPETEDWHDHLATLHESGMLGLRMVNDLLDFAKLGAGKLQLENVPFSLRACLEAVLMIVRPHGTATPVEVGYELPAGVGDVELTGDPHKVRQVLLNLLANALKFTHAGSVLLTVHLPGAAKESRQETVCVEVQDTGIGISPERAGHLFQPYTQAESSTHRRYGGTGLGLSISRSLAEAMGGSLTFRSTLGEGTTFVLTLPCAPACRPPSDLFLGRRLLLIEPSALRGVSLAHHCAGLNLQVERYASLGAAECALDASPPFDGIVCATSLLGPDRPPRLWGLPVLPIGGSLEEHPFDSPNSRDKAHPPSLGVAGRAAPPALSIPILRSALEKRLTTLFHGSDVRAESRPPLTPPPPLRILVADDNAINRKVLASFARRLGCHADVVCDGAKAVEQATQHAYDVVFLDLEMPTMGGLEATAALRQHTPSVTVVGITGHNSEEARARCLQAGMEDFVAKPIHFEEFARLLPSLARIAKPSPPLQPQPPPRRRYIRKGSCGPLSINIPAGPRVLHSLVGCVQNSPQTPSESDFFRHSPKNASFPASLATSPLKAHSAPVNSSFPDSPRAYDTLPPPKPTSSPPISLATLRKPAIQCPQHPFNPAPIFASAPLPSSVFPEFQLEGLELPPSPSASSGRSEHDNLARADLLSLTAQDGDAFPLSPSQRRKKLFPVSRVWGPRLCGDRSVSPALAPLPHHLGSIVMGSRKRDMTPLLGPTPIPPPPSSTSSRPSHPGARQSFWLSRKLNRHANHTLQPVADNTHINPHSF